jgi:hypothetical protein
MGAASVILLAGVAGRAVVAGSADFTVLAPHFLQNFFPCSICVPH